MAAKRKKDYTAYILPMLFCGLLIVLAVVTDRQKPRSVKAVLQEGEPLTLNEQAIENYLYSGGFTLAGDAVLTNDGRKAAALTVTMDADGSIEGVTLSYPLPTYYETGNGGDILSGLKANHDAAAQQGVDMFLCLFDAIAATDGRAAARRDGAVEKLRGTMDTGKASVQAANSWRFNFSLEPGEIEGAVTILFEKVK